jgi:N-acetylmuramoyl-L-alanine amidase
MNRLAVLFGLLVLSATLQVSAAQTLVKGLRLWTAPDHTRLVFDTEGPVEHQEFALHRPERLVIDLQRAHFGGRLPLIPASARFIQHIRSGPHGGQDLRVVLELKQPAHAKSFSLTPDALYGHRLVVDLQEQKGHPPIAVAPKPRAKILHRPERPRSWRNLVIAVDAGHGGDDPGAVGPKGTFEKDVVLGIARRLARRISAEPGMRAVLTRKGDYYIGLRKRVEKARQAHADLFVSIHADSSPNDEGVTGASIYTLSERGASNEAARWLAEKENAADLVGGVALDDKGNLLATVLLDMSMSATMESSRQAAESVLRQLRRAGQIHKQDVQYAGFVVLKAPDIPGMLVETAYISNPVEEAQLRDPTHQGRLAMALFTGIRDYFQSYPPPGTRMAQSPHRHHVVERGDTLSTLAQEYQVKLDELRHANHLVGDQVRLGQVLTIPES